MSFGTTIPQAPPKLAPSMRNGTVQVEFLKNISGARRFVLPSRRAYKFDAQERLRYMPREDAVELVQRFGESTFRIVPEL